MREFLPWNNFRRFDKILEVKWDIKKNLKRFNVKSKIDKKLVVHLAQLVNLELTTEKIGVYQEQLSVIADHFNDLKSLSFQGVAETSRVVDEANVWREDKVKPSLSQQEALKNSDRTHDGYFVVDYVLTEKED